MSAQQSSEGNAVDDMVCAACGKRDASLKICTGCRLVRYCGRDCQVSHRKAHKNVCRMEQQRTWANAKNISGECKNKRDIALVIERFVHAFMYPILGMGPEKPFMWDVCYKKGAKERIHNHMLSFMMNYVSIHTDYQSDDTMKRLLQKKYEPTEDFVKEPIFGSMQEELYCYLKQEEKSYD